MLECNTLFVIDTIWVIECLYVLCTTDDTLIILASLGVGAIVLIVVVITVAIVVSRKRNGFVFHYIDITNSFIHSFISGRPMHHCECVAPNVGIILQSGRF